MTLATTRGKFAHICIELDLKKPLRLRYLMQGREWHLQYEGLHDICFGCREYGHREINCPLKTSKAVGTTEGSSSGNSPIGMKAQQPMAAQPEVSKTSYGSWMVAQRARRQPGRMGLPNYGAPASATAQPMNDTDHGQQTGVSRSKEHGQTVAATGSRFSMLNDQEEVSATDNNVVGEEVPNATVTKMDKPMGSRKGKAPVREGMA